MPWDDEGDYEMPRPTTTHWRYHIAGFLSPDDTGELLDHATRRDDAFEIARLHARKIGKPGEWTRISVWDMMARRGHPQLWEFDRDGNGRVIERRIAD